MTARNLIQQNKAQREQEASRQQWLERINKPNKPVEVLTYGGVPLSEYVRIQKAQENAMALEGLKQKSALGRTGMEQAGLTKRTGMEQTGMTGRTNLEQAGMTGRNTLAQTGLDTRNKRDVDLNKRKLAGDQFKMLQELGATNDLRENPINFGQRFKDFNTSMGVGNGISQNQRQYTPVERDNGMTGYYDNAGKLAYTDLTDPDSKPTKSGMKYNGLQNLKANDLDGNGGESVDIGYGNMAGQKETKESIYGSRPTLKDIWAEDERRKKERNAKRKSQWTVPY